MDDDRQIPALRDISDADDIDDEQQYVRDIELPNAFQEFCGTDNEAAFEHDARIDERGGVARNEHEQIGGVAEAIVSAGEPVHDVVRNMVDEDDPVREAPEEVEAQVAPAGGKHGFDLAHGSLVVRLRVNGRTAGVQVATSGQTSIDRVSCGRVKCAIGPRSHRAEGCPFRWIVPMETTPQTTLIRKRQRSGPRPQRGDSQPKHDGRKEWAKGQLDKSNYSMDGAFVTGGR